LAQICKFQGKESVEQAQGRLTMLASICSTNGWNGLAGVGLKRYLKNVSDKMMFLAPRTIPE